jgi:hypothetical protein
MPVMNGRSFDRDAVRFRPLAERKNKVLAPRDLVLPGQAPGLLTASAAETLQEVAARIKAARSAGSSVVCAFGAHAVKNGLGPVLAALMSQGWFTHLATNGAGIIHDWEIAFQGGTSEDVRENVAKGEFGIWEETGRYVNLAILVGAYEGLGYGQSVGALIANQGLTVPRVDQLRRLVPHLLKEDPDRAAAGADLLSALEAQDIPSGFMKVPHPFSRFSVQAEARRLSVPFTGHPSIGHDIIYAHPWNSGAAVGRAAIRDFLGFAHSISRLEGGVYLSVGSAVMSPMIFEKAFSMAQNVALQSGAPIRNHYILVVDIAESPWDWQRDGEPPADNPAYYLRFCKTFARMGGTMRYLRADNRDFFLSLLRALS